MKFKINIPDHYRKLNIPIILLFAIGSIFTTILIIQTPTIYAYDSSCDNLYKGSNLWSHTYDHSRFFEYDKNDLSKNCITVTGKVVSIIPPEKGEGDGDYHFNMLADTAQYSNPANCKNPPPAGQKCQELIVEIVCYDHNAIKFLAAQNACKNYKNDIKGPKKGDSVTVTGKWLKDEGVKKDHNWNEIHPATKVVIK